LKIVVGCDDLRKKWPLDKKDLQILAALDEMGGNASAQEIGDKCAKYQNIEGLKDESRTEDKIPARTVRYRLSMLMERGILLPSFIQVDERKVGFAEGVLVLQESGKKSEDLERLINDIPIFYWYVSTHGKHDGYLVHTVYDLKHPNLIHDLCKVMIEKGFIEDYSFFDIVDFASKKIDFTRYNPSGEWSMDWDDWIKKIAKNLDCEIESPFSLSLEHEEIEYDGIDIEILRHLLNNSDTSMSTLAILTGIPIAKIRDRVQKLRDGKAIKGYERAYGFSGDILWFSCIMDISDSVGGILTSIHELPFPAAILMENESKYCIRLGLTTSDLKRFLEGFKLIRRHLNSYSIQFHLPDKTETKYQSIFDLFDKTTNQWKMPLKEYIGIIENHAKSIS